MAKLTKEQEYRALLLEVQTAVSASTAFGSTIPYPLWVVLAKIQAALSEPDAQDGEAA